MGRTCTENKAFPLLWGRHCRLGRSTTWSIYHLRPAPTYVVPRRFRFPFWDPTAIPQCYLFAILSDRLHRRTHRSSPMDEHRGQGFETSKPLGATSHSGADVHPKNQEGAAADLVTHTT